MHQPNVDTPQLQYYRQRQFKPGWQDLVQVIFSGILATADDADGREFLQLMGRQLAQQHPLPLAHTVGDLEDRLNELLACFDWGLVHIDANEQQLTLTHSACPLAPQAEAQPRWLAAFGAVLTGAYGEWLQRQGGAPQVPLRWHGGEDEATLIFLYGNAQ